MKSPDKKLNGKLLLVLLTSLILVAFVAPQYSPFAVDVAHSQVKKQKKRKNFFDMLFGKRGSLNLLNRKNRKAKRVKLQKKKIRRKRAPAPVVAKLKKNEHAAKILVAGDFMAGGLAWGLTQAFAENPDVIIVDISKGLSGFVRNDVKDWPGTIATHIEEVKPAAVVFLAGMNDRQRMTLATSKVNKLSTQWRTAYISRTESLAKTVEGKNVPLIWVGLPPTRSRKMTVDYLVFNEIYRTQVEAVGGLYVDVWDGFTNAEGQFVSAGPDINGQIVRLRSSDGINMTKTGKRKLAFYANKAIRKLTGIGTESLLVSLPGIDNSVPVTPQYDPAKSGKSVVYSLAGPALDGGATLDGVKTVVDEKEAKRSVSYELVNSGQLPKTHPGRIDHYGIVANEVMPIITDDNIATQEYKEEIKPVDPKT